ncbi:putative DNA-directed RNA polymerase I subunit RPA43-like [Apostichopus japonicus]|uniref:Putative DNA-directed RNA polymerase I subunit RPA43-like n=1 Tax=Stichopus japonicus TaxID=307972 RepID=A0A2G8KCL4_STIJA|nr:putative DNA-directed RNA polymerase I subunit RPA43-like [Apostichopus japonicus]
MCGWHFARLQQHQDNTEEAVLLYDDVDMHMDVRYDAVIFRVVPGSLLKCKINEVSAAHISCLTHKIINITVELPDINFDLHDPKGLEIVCRLKKVEYQKGVLGLSAELTDDSLNTLQELCINDDGSKGHGTKHKKKQKRQKNKSSSASNTANPGSVGLSDEGKEGSKTNGDGPKEPGDAIINDDGSKGHGTKHKKKQKRQTNKSSRSSDVDDPGSVSLFDEGKEGSETMEDGPKEPGDAIINDDGSKGHGTKHKKKQKRQANKSSRSSDVDDPGSVGLSDEGKEGSETMEDGPKEPGDAIINDDGPKEHGTKHKKKQKRQANKSSRSSDVDDPGSVSLFDEGKEGSETMEDGPKEPGDAIINDDWSKGHRTKHKKKQKRQTNKSSRPSDVDDPGSVGLSDEGKEGRETMEDGPKEPGDAIINDDWSKGHRTKHKKKQKRHKNNSSRSSDVDVPSITETFNEVTGENRRKHRERKHSEIMEVVEHDLDLPSPDEIDELIRKKKTRKRKQERLPIEGQFDSGSVDYASTGNTSSIKRKKVKH